jgi:hypothetical protein
MCYTLLNIADDCMIVIFVFQDIFFEIAPTITSFIQLGYPGYLLRLYESLAEKLPAASIFSV